MPRGDEPPAPSFLAIDDCDEAKVGLYKLSPADP
jgi:hypothetical protein